MSFIVKGAGDVVGSLVPLPVNWKMIETFGEYTSQRLMVMSGPAMGDRFRILRGREVHATFPDEAALQAAWHALQHPSDDEEGVERNEDGSIRMIPKLTGKVSNSVVAKYSALFDKGISEE
eukprot:TRINITY_DN14957_c0_g1_i1.p2 TRINITY_DN14957_c0_g1~~TRINITY_DN14957_c0_g1_i1.p2  ORF type:complete len:121 (-),score=38.53 TRINITY_DN14957_c0_g1_i1:93-455(-)